MRFVREPVGSRVTLFGGVPRRFGVLGRSLASRPTGDRQILHSNYISKVTGDAHGETDHIRSSCRWGARDPHGLENFSPRTWKRILRWSVSLSCKAFPGDAERNPLISREKPRRLENLLPSNDCCIRRTFDCSLSIRCYLFTSLMPMPQEGESVETEEEGRGGKGTNCAESVRYLHASHPPCISDRTDIPDPKWLLRCSCNTTQHWSLRIAC